MGSGKVIRIHVAGVLHSSTLNVAALLGLRLSDQFPEAAVDVIDLSDGATREDTAVIVDTLDSRLQQGTLSRVIEEQDTAFIVTHRAIENGEDREVLPGLYRHYKGGEFEVVRVVKDCDVDRDYVVFHRTGDADGQWYTRTLGEFNSVVSGDVASGQENKIRRFEKL